MDGIYLRSLKESIKLYFQIKIYQTMKNQTGMVIS